MRGLGAFTLFAGPLAWFAELNIGYVLATEPCFPTDHRLLSPEAQWGWTHSALFGLAGICLLVAALGMASSWRALRPESGPLHASTAAGTRGRFAALWGVAFGVGFFVATALTCVGLVLLPRCGG